MLPALRVRYEVLPVPDDHLRERQVREAFQALVRPAAEIRPQEVEHVAEMVVVAGMRRRGQEERVLGLLLLAQVLGQVVHLDAGLRKVMRLVEDDEIPRVGVQGRSPVPRDFQRVNRRNELVERLELVHVAALEQFEAAPEARGELHPPLIHEPRRSDDQAAERAAGAVAHDLEDHAGLDSLAEANVIGDEPMAAAVLGGRACEHAVRDDDLMRQHVERLVRDLAGLLVARLEPAAEDPELEWHSGTWPCARKPSGQVPDNPKLLHGVLLDTGRTAPGHVRTPAAGDLLDEAHDASPERRVAYVLDPISYLQRSHPMPPCASRR